MTKEDLAAQLDGVEYPCYISNELKAQAAAAGLVIIFGASDDLMEFRGAINDEVGAYGTTVVKVDKIGVLTPWEQVDRKDEQAAERYFQRKPGAREIKAIWDRDGYSWQYETTIPHATFEVVEEGDTYCRGIVFSLADL